MSHEEYKRIIDEALQFAGSGCGWDERFELHLLKNGLKIVTEQPPQHPLGNDYRAPAHTLPPRTYSYGNPAWIVEAENTKG